MTCLVFYEGVLMSSQDRPILFGFQLVQSLAASHRIVVLTDGLADRVEHQMRTERLQDHVAEIIDQTVALEPIPLWQRQIEMARSRWAVSFILTSDPRIAEYAIQHGMVSLYFAHPGFSVPAMRPEVGNRNWEELIEELDKR